MKNKYLKPYIRFFTALSILWVCFSPFAKAQYSGPYDPESISTFVTENNINSVDDFLKELPEDLRSQFSLVYDTRNKAQHASHAKPRVLLFSPDGKFYMSFTGSEDVKGGNVVEMISQTEQGNYRFSTLSFEDGAPRMHKDIKSCTGCHGKNPRPIWDGYPKWPGAYGSDHDVMRLDSGNYGKEKTDIFVKNSKEVKDLSAFNEIGINKDRYIHLANIPRNESTKRLYPYLANMNMHMSEVVADSLHREIIGELLSKPESGRYLPFLIDTVGKAHGREVYLVDEDFKDFPSENPQEDLRKYRELDKQRSSSLSIHQKSITNRLDALNPGAHPKGFFSHFAVVDQSAFSLVEYIGREVGVGEEFWRSGVQGTIRQAGGGAPPYVGFFNELVEQMKFRDPELEKHVRVKTYGDSFLYEITDEGKARIKANPSLYTGELPLKYQDTQNRSLSKYRELVGGTVSAGTIKQCGNFFQKMLKTIKAGL